MAKHNIASKKHTNAYFAAANSAYGFYSLFGEIYNERELDSLYIIKGGPGTGKSTLMNKAAEKAEKLGYSVDIYYCSSDTSSLDGVYINELKTALIDGTAPHIHDPKFPGVSGEIINLGDGWDHEKLLSERSAIERLFSEKSAAYERVYRYLSAAGTAETDIIKGIEYALLKDKMTSAVKRIIAKNIGVKSGYSSAKRRFISAYGKDGRKTLETLWGKAERIINVTDFYGSGRIIMDKVKETGRDYGLDMTVAPSPLLPEHAEAVYFESSGVLYILSENDGDETVNSKRFVNNEKLKEIRGKLRFSEKIKETLISEAERSLHETGVIHEKIEEIYKSAMDFGVVEKMTAEVMRKIFG